MSEFYRFLSRLLVRTALWALVAYALVHALIPAAAASLTTFVLTPGGFVAVVLLWRWLGRRRERS